VVGGVNDTSEYDTADLGASKFDVLWLLLKGIPVSIKKKSYIGKSFYTISTPFIQKIWGLTRDDF
jgi:hypothetical protein